MEKLTYSEFKNNLKREQEFYKIPFCRRLLFGRNYEGEFMRHLRWAEFCKSRSGLFFNILRLYHQRMMKYYSYKTGIQITLNTIDWGCRIYHFGTIIVNHHARIGKNLIIYPGVTIGAHNGTPTIGNNVYIGLGAKVIGGITIGDNVTIAPNSIVNKNVPSNTIVGGVPFKVIKNKFI